MNKSNERVGRVYKSNNCGDMVVVDYINNNNVTVQFVDTGYETSAKWVNIENGNIKDKYCPSICGIGFIAEGSHLLSINGKKTKPYQVWRDMLARCYCPKRQSKSPTYKGCTICDDWHNFQVFAEWYVNNCPTDGGSYHLDKDIKIKGNKIYSPDTCMFVTPAENIIAARAMHYVVTDPYGVEYDVYNLSEFCNQKGLRRSTIVQMIRGKNPPYKRWLWRHA